MVRLLSTKPEREWLVDAVLSEGSRVYALQGSERRLLATWKGLDWDYAASSLDGRPPFVLPVGEEELVVLVGGKEVARDDAGFAFFCFEAKPELYLKHLGIEQPTLAASSHQGRWSRPTETKEEHLASDWTEVVIARPGYLLPEWVHSDTRPRARPSALAQG